MTENERKTISYNPSEEALAFLNEHTKEGSTMTKSGLIEVAVRLLMAWPEEEFIEIVGNSISTDRLESWVKTYVDTIRHMKD